MRAITLPLIAPTALGKFEPIITRLYMATVTLSTHGRIDLPLDLTQRLGWQGGAEIEMIEEADGLRLLARPSGAG